MSMHSLDRHTTRAIASRTRLPRGGTKAPITDTQLEVTLHLEVSQGLHMPTNNLMDPLTTLIPGVKTFMAAAMVDNQFQGPDSQPQGEANPRINQGIHMGVVATTTLHSECDMEHALDGHRMLLELSPVCPV